MHELGSIAMEQSHTPFVTERSRVLAEKHRLRKLREYEENVWVSVSATTRAPRAGETDGESYFFLSRDHFAVQAQAGEFLEYAEFAGNMYGTPRVAVAERLAQGVNVVLEIDLAGARQVRAAMPEAVLVFIAPPSWDELQARLIGRGTESEEVIERRLAVARTELAAEAEFDATIVNDEVGAAVKRLLSLVESP
jgi:guanylate kinase